jgi:hypothetical protein
VVALTPPSEKFARAEWIFDLSKAYLNPYYSYDASDTPAANPPMMNWFGADGVSVDMHLVSPSNKSITVPAFWMVDYTRVKDSNFSAEGDEVLGAKDNGRWHVRFTPEEVGTYQYYLTAQDRSGTGPFIGGGELSREQRDDEGVRAYQPQGLALHGIRRRDAVYPYRRGPAVVDR